MEYQDQLVDLQGKDYQLKRLINVLSFLFTQKKYSTSTA
jgi:hypothetical protein